MCAFCLCFYFMLHLATCRGFFVLSFIGCLGQLACSSTNSDHQSGDLELTTWKTPIGTEVWNVWFSWDLTLWFLGASPLVVVSCHSAKSLGVMILWFLDFLVFKLKIEKMPLEVICGLEMLVGWIVTRTWSLFSGMRFIEEAETSKDKMFYHWCISVLITKDVHEDIFCFILKWEVHICGSFCVYVVGFS